MRTTASNALQPADPASRPVTPQRKCSCEASGETCPRCEAKRHSLQRKSNGTPSGADISPVVDRVLASPGHAMDPVTRGVMESRFAQDFSHVRLHEDRDAAISADSIHARAYTVGRHIVMGADAPARSSSGGMRLLAHELAHVVQQSRGGIPAGIDADPALESAADRAATDVVSGKDAEVSGAAGTGIAREAKPGEQIIYEVTFPDGKKRLTEAEYEAHKARAIRRLRIDLKTVAELADNGRSSQIDMLKDYHGGVESGWDVIKKPKALIGIAADIWGNTTPPYIGMWSHAKNYSKEGLAALERGDFATAARMLRLADQSYRDSVAEWNAYRAKTIGGAEALASDLETVRDISFATALAAAAVIAAPVVAGGVAAAGFTGTTATVLTAGGTAVATGSVGVGLGGGSTAAASYVNTGKVDWDAAARDAKKFGKQGAVTGLTAGLGHALGAAGKAVELGKPLVQQAVRRCLTEAGINVTGEVTAEALDRLVPPSEPEAAAKSEAQSKAVLPGPARAALVGCVGGALGVPTSKLRSGTAKVTDAAVGAGVAYGDARLQGKTHVEAVLAAVQTSVTSHAIGYGKKHSDAVAAAKPVGKATDEVAGKPETSRKAIVTTPTKGSPVATAKPTVAEIPGSPIPSTAKPVPKPAAKPAGKPAVSVDKAHAKAVKPAANGHEAVVTRDGVGVCSPLPCPVIHVEYKKELGASPELKKWNDHIQGMREANPEGAATQAAALIKALEAQRNNAARAAGAPRDAVDDAFDTAHAPNVSKKGGRSYLDADMETGSARKRAPGEPKRRVDLDDLVPTADERKLQHPHRAAAARARAVQGRRIADHPKLKALWDAAAAKAQANGPLTKSNYAKSYDKARDEFWLSVRGDKEAKAIFEHAGFDFEASGKAPLLRVKDPSAVPLEERRISLDHNVEKGHGDGWRLALDPANLTFEMQTPNSMREIKQARHPELRPKEPQ